MLKRGDIDALHNKMREKQRSVTKVERELIVDLCKHFFVTDMNEDLGTLIGKVETILETAETQARVVIAFEARFEAMNGRLDNLLGSYNGIYTQLTRKRWYQFWR